MGELFIPYELSFLMCEDKDKGPCLRELLQRLSEQMQKDSQDREYGGYAIVAIFLLCLWGIEPQQIRLGNMQGFALAFKK